MRIRLNKFLILLLLLMTYPIVAHGAEEIQFPVQELGNCASKTACRTYCNKTENIEACSEFARKQNLATLEDTVRARRLVTALQAGGPGGCKTAATCKTYCEDSAHISECADFAKKFGLITQEETERLKTITSQDIKKEFPTGCTSLRSCRTFCAKEVNAEVCLDFAERVGVLPQREITRARELLPPREIKINPSTSPVRTRTPVPVVSRAPIVTPRLERTPLPKLPTESVRPSIRPELLNGGATNLPSSQVPRKTSYRKAYLGSILHFFFR